MKKVLLSCTVISFLTIGLAAWLVFLRPKTKSNRAVTFPVKREFVVEWDVVSPNDVNIPRLSKMQLIDEIKKSIKAQQALHSWEAKYNIISHQTPRKLRNMTIPEIINSSHIHIIANGSKWFYEKQEEMKNKTTNEISTYNTRYVSNGETISKVWPDRKNGQVQSANQAIFVNQPTLANFLPSLPSGLPTVESDFPEGFDILEASDTKLLPWYTRVDNQTCYVLELKATLKHPFFRNSEEVESWKKANPKEAETWSKAARQGIVININYSNTPEGTRETETTIRLAIAPKLGFAIVRWAYGYGTNTGNIQGHIFPTREIKYGNFCKISNDIFVPREMLYIEYGPDEQLQRQITYKERKLLLEEFAINKEYNPEFFEVHFPVGYSVVDSDRGISYIVGDSEEKVNTLATAAKARDDFYNKLRSEEAPDLEYAEWINSKPIHLADYKGRQIILHFWSLGCSPCMAELPELQKEYGHVLEHTSSPLFISIHPFVDGSDLRQVKKTIEKNGITFPVMIDAPDLESRSWGKTFKKYMIFGIPTNVKIGENGHFAEIDRDYINKGSPWISNPQD